MTFLDIVLMLTIEAGLFVGVAMAVPRANRPRTRMIGLGLAVGSFAACLGTLFVRFK